jgi:hypothetical protein
MISVLISGAGPRRRPLRPPSRKTKRRWHDTLKNMRPILPWAIAACMLFIPPAARAANPDDLDFVLRLTRDPPVFHAGEPIEFELSYSTRTTGKYRGTWTNPSPDLDVVTLHLTTVSGLVDRRSFREGGFAGSILSGIGNLDPQHPVTQKADLADWYLFEKSGHYELRISSSQTVSRVKTTDEGGGLAPIALESNTVEFDVLARDAAWETQELAAALQDLDADPPAHAQALHRLVLLDTPGSILKLVSLFLDGDQNDSGSAYRGLQESAHPEVIAPLLEAALEDPQRRSPSNLVDLLAGLQVRRELGPPSAAPEDLAKRYKKLQEYMAQDTAKLLASLRQRSGPERSIALFQAWQLAERNNSSPDDPPQALVQLRKEVLANVSELPLSDLMNLVTQMWYRNSMPREQLLPHVRSLALAAGRAPTDLAFRLQAEVYPLWCEESPRECSDAILAEAAKPDSPLLPQTILLLKESEHPELDAVLKQRLVAVAALKDLDEMQKTGALVLRVGSRNLRPAVEEALDHFAGKRVACEPHAYLVNYLFRFAPKAATQYLRTAFQDPSSSCGWLHFLGHTRYSDDLIPIAIDALDSPNPTIAGSGALFLGEHGPADTEDLLWRRLDKLWDKWRDRAAELRSADMLIPGPWATEHFEQALVSALVHGANWKLTLAEQDRLRAGCLTDECRRFAAGEVSLGY